MPRQVSPDNPSPRRGELSRSSDSSESRSRSRASSFSPRRDRVSSRSISPEDRSVKRRRSNSPGNSTRRRSPESPRYRRSPRRSTSYDRERSSSRRSPLSSQRTSFSSRGHSSRYRSPKSRSPTSLRSHDDSGNSFRGLFRSASHRSPSPSRRGSPPYRDGAWRSPSPHRRRSPPYRDGAWRSRSPHRRQSPLYRSATQRSPSYYRRHSPEYRGEARRSISPFRGRGPRPFSGAIQRSSSPGRRYSPPASPGRRYSPPASPGRRYGPPASPDRRYSPPASPDRRYSPPASPDRVNKHGRIIPKLMNKFGPSGRSYPSAPPPIGRYNSRRHREESPVRDDYTCKKCDLVFFAHDKFIRHIQRARRNRKCSPPERQIKCRKCDKEFPMSELDEHEPQCAGVKKKARSPSSSPSPPPGPNAGTSSSRSQENERERSLSPSSSATIKPEAQPKQVAPRPNVPEVITLDESDSSSEDLPPKSGEVLQEALVTSSQALSPISSPVSPPTCSSASPPRAGSPNQVINTSEGSMIYVFDSHLQDSNLQGFPLSLDSEPVLPAPVPLRNTLPLSTILNNFEISSPTDVTPPPIPQPVPPPHFSRQTSRNRDPRKLKNKKPTIKIADFALLQKSDSSTENINSPSMGKFEPKMISLPESTFQPPVPQMPTLDVDLTVSDDYTPQIVVEKSSSQILKDPRLRSKSISCKSSDPDRLKQILNKSGTASPLSPQKTVSQSSLIPFSKSKLPPDKNEAIRKIPASPSEDSREVEGRRNLNSSLKESKQVEPKTKRLPASLFEEPQKEETRPKPINVVDKHKNDQSKLDQLFEKQKPRMRSAPVSHTKDSPKTSRLIKLVASKANVTTNVKEARKLSFSSRQNSVTLIDPLPMQVDSGKKKNDLKHLTSKSIKISSNKEDRKNTTKGKGSIDVSKKSKQAKLSEQLDNKKPKSFEAALGADEVILKRSVKKAKNISKEKDKKNKNMAGKYSEGKDKKGRKTKSISDYFTKQNEQSSKIGVKNSKDDTLKNKEKNSSTSKVRDPKKKEMHKKTDKNLHKINTKRSNEKCVSVKSKRMKTDEGIPSSVNNSNANPTVDNIVNIVEDPSLNCEKGIPISSTKDLKTPTAPPSTNPTSPILKQVKSKSGPLVQESPSVGRSAVEDCSSSFKEIENFIPTVSTKSLEETTSSKSPAQANCKSVLLQEMHSMETNQEQVEGELSGSIPNVMVNENFPQEATTRIPASSPSTPVEGRLSQEARGEMSSTTQSALVKGSPSKESTPKISSSSSAMVKGSSSQKSMDKISGSSSVLVEGGSFQEDTGKKLVSSASALVERGSFKDYRGGKSGSSASVLVEGDSAEEVTGEKSGSSVSALVECGSFQDDGGEKSGSSASDLVEGGSVQENAGEKLESSSSTLVEGGSCQESTDKISGSSSNALVEGGSFQEAMGEKLVSFPSSRVEGGSIQEDRVEKLVSSPSALVEGGSLQEDTGEKSGSSPSSLVENSTSVSSKSHFSRSQPLSVSKSWELHKNLGPEGKVVNLMEALGMDTGVNDEEEEEYILDVKKDDTKVCPFCIKQFVDARFDVVTSFIKLDCSSCERKFKIRMPNVFPHSAAPKLSSRKYKLLNKSS